MKNTFKVLGIIAILTVIGFSMAACSGNDDDSGSSGGNTLSGTYYREGSSGDYITFPLMVLGRGVMRVILVPVLIRLGGFG